MFVASCSGYPHRLQSVAISVGYIYSYTLVIVVAICGMAQRVGRYVCAAVVAIWQYYCYNSWFNCGVGVWWWVRHF